MTVEGELDDISGSGQTRAAQDMCTGVADSDRLHLEVPGAGHYGIFSGSRWRTIVYPQVVKFIKSHAVPVSAKATAPVGSVKAAAPAKAKVAVVKPAAAPKAVAKPAAKAPVKAAASAKAKVAVKPATKASAPAVKTNWVEPKNKA
jgi:poly(3-hydroxybutyrate) depolymerase